MPKKRFEQRLEDYRNGKGKKKSPQRRLRALGIIVGLAFVVYCCVASLYNQEEVYAAPSTLLPETRHAREAPGWVSLETVPGGRVVGRPVARVLGTRRRLHGGEPLVARRRPAYLTRGPAC